MKKIFVLISTFTLFLIFDFFWLGTIAVNLYQNEIGHLFAKEFNYIAVLILYILLSIGLTFFAIVPALEAKSIKILLGRALFFGFFTYVTYDLTNLATLRDWPVQLSVIDIAWGVFNTTATSLLCYKLSSKFFKG